MSLKSHPGRIGWAALLIVLTALIVLIAQNGLASSMAVPEDAVPEGDIPEDGIPQDGIPQDYGQPHPEASPELSQFAFLIGHWQCDVTYTNPDWETTSQGNATWTAYYIQDGLAIMDDFRGGYSEDAVATTVRAYDRQTQKWSGYWLDGRSGTWSRPLEGQATDDGMLLKTSTLARSPQGDIIDVELQYQFYEIHDDHFRWRQNASLDDAKTWRRDTMTLYCQRLEGPNPMPEDNTK